MSTITNPAFNGLYSNIAPLSINTINIAPLSTDSLSAMSQNTIPSITLGGTGGGGTGGTAYPGTYSLGSALGSANVTWSAGNIYSNGMHPNPTISISTPNTYTGTSTMTVKGDAEFEGNVKIGGKDLLELLNKIEGRLAIYKPNAELEEKWEELRELSTRYKELEAEIQEKEKVWAILKK